MKIKVSTFIDGNLYAKNIVVKDKYEHAVSYMLGQNLLDDYDLSEATKIKGDVKVDEYIGNGVTLVTGEVICESGVILK